MNQKKCKKKKKKFFNGCGDLSYYLANCYLEGRVGRVSSTTYMSERNDFQSGEISGTFKNNLT